MHAEFSLVPQATQYDSIELLLADWDRQVRVATGHWFIYVFRDAGGSAFYVGKGQGGRATDADGHRHGRLGYYISRWLDGVYTVDILRRDLSNDDAELLEASLINHFGRQFVNWANNLGSMLTAATVTQMRARVQALRARARAAASEDRSEDAIAICHEALAYLSEWEANEHEAEIQSLEQLADTWLAARVDLQRARNDYIPQAPVLACEMLSDLTRYLCVCGRAEEAQREVDAFTVRYPHGSFREYEMFDDRYGKTLRVSVTKREQATLRRVARALRHAEKTAR
jgi:hypothetical protein